MKTDFQQPEYSLPKPEPAIAVSGGYEPFKQVDLFAGIGGFSLAGEWVGWETIAWCEWSGFCQEILKFYWPNAKQHHDITKTDFTIYRGLVDVLTGGFPCQGFSVAGSRFGTNDDRYLWPEMRRAYREMQPAVIIGENVTGLISMEDQSGVYRDVFAQVESRTITRICEVDKYEAIYTRQAKMLVDSICNDLEEDGYEVQPIVVPASAVQAPHRRDRIWFIAYRNGYDAGRSRHGKTGQTPRTDKSEKEKRERIRAEFERIGNQRNVADANGQRLQESDFPTSGNGTRFDSRLHNASNDANSISFGLRGKSYGFGESGFFGKTGAPNDWRNFPTELPILLGDDGLSARLDGITFSELRTQSIKSAGNAIVPQVAYEFFKAIQAQRFSTNGFSTNGS